MSDALGDRMKMYEGIESDRRLIPLLPICARLDGKSFHSFCKGLKRPYDHRFSYLMTEVTKYLVEETNARIGYTQSDEISLVYYSPYIGSQVFFDGRTQKMTSVLSAMCSVKFNQLLPVYIPEKENKLPVFDCRVWNVPDLIETTNTMLWRELDATKNSISMAARTYYSNKELFKKNSSEKQELLHQKGINWNDYPSFFKRGTYIQRRKTIRKFTIEELDKLPSKHAARTNPNLEVERTEIRVIEMPPLSKVANRVDVIFGGADPVVNN